MKKEVRGFIMGMLMTGVVLSCIPAFASNAPKAVSIAINSVKIALNGTTVPLDNINYNGNTYVKLSQVCNLIGKTVSWDGKSRTVNIKDVTTSQPAISVPQKTTQTKDLKSTAKPRIKASTAHDDGKAVDVIFYEKLDKASAENVANYTLKAHFGQKATVKILSATLDESGTKVTLKTEEQQVSTLYDLCVSNIKSEAGSVMDTYYTTVVGCNKIIDKDPNDFCMKKYEKLSTTSIKITFTHNLEKNSAQNTSNYTIRDTNHNTLNILKAELCQTQNQVILTFSEPKENTPYQILCSNILDQDGDKVSPVANFSVVLNDSQNNNNELSRYGDSGAYTGVDRSYAQYVIFPNEDHSSVVIKFYKKLNKSDAENVANYSIVKIINEAFSSYGKAPVISTSDKNPIISATLDSTGTKVVLKTQQELQDKQMYNIVVENFRDEAGNTVGGFNLRLGVYYNNINTYRENTGIHMEAVKVLSPISVQIKYDKIDNKEIITNPAKYTIQEDRRAQEKISVTNAVLGQEQNTVILTLEKPMSDVLYSIILDDPIKEECEYQAAPDSPIVKSESTSYPSTAFWGESAGFPEVVSAQSLSNNSIEIVFSDLMQKVSTETVSNYQISSTDGTKKLDIISAKLDDSGKKVILTTSEQENIDYKVTVNSIYSSFKMPVSDKSTTLFKGTANIANTEP